MTLDDSALPGAWYKMSRSKWLQETPLHTLPYPIDHKSTKMSSSSISFADTSRLNGPEANRNPTFHRAVERAAVFMCRQAIKAGKLRVVTPARPTTQFTPRYLFFCV